MRTMIGATSSLCQLHLMLTTCRRSFRTRRNGSASPRQVPANAPGQLADIHEPALIGEDNYGKAEET